MDYFNKMMNLYFEGKFGLIMDLKFIDKIPENQAVIVREFLDKFNLNVFADNKKKFDVVVEIYNKFCESQDNYWYSPISEDSINNMNKDLKSFENLLKSLESNPSMINDFKNNIKCLLQENPHNYVSGNLHYLMSKSEIRDSLVSSLEGVRVLTPSEFSELDENQWFECNSNHISRIFGAKYLKSCFEKNGVTKFRVPEFIIVVDNNDNNKTLKMTIHFGNYFPSVTIVSGARIFSEKIIGKNVANQYVGDKTLLGCQYDDLIGDNGNIIRDDSGVNFIVDTETNSFDMKNTMTCLPYKNPCTWNKFLIFSRHHFFATNVDTFDKIQYCEIDVTI